MGDRIYKWLFEGDEYVYNTQNIIVLLNYLSTKKQIPNDIQILWGDAITFGTCICLCNFSIENSFNKPCNQYLFCGHRYVIKIPMHPSYY